MNQKPSIGRIVHYVLPYGSCKGQHRAAMITGVNVDDTLNLSVFRDQHADPSNASFADGREAGSVFVCQHPLYLVRDVHHGELQKPGTWHWPERVE